MDSWVTEARPFYLQQININLCKIASGIWLSPCRNKCLSIGYQVTMPLELGYFETISDKLKWAQWSYILDQAHGPGQRTETSCTCSYPRSLQATTKDVSVSTWCGCDQIEENKDKQNKQTKTLDLIGIALTCVSTRGELLRVESSSPWTVFSHLFRSSSVSFTSVL